MKLGDDQLHVTLSVSQEAYTQGAKGEDVIADVDVRVYDFAAGIAVVVARSDWEEFLPSLVRLEKTRRGEAVLRSAFEPELQLRIYAMDSAGHMAASGQIERQDLPSFVRFIFEAVEFDPGLLPELVSECASVFGSSP